MRSEAALSVLLSVVLLAVACVGCDRPPREVRVALEQTAGGLVVADQLLSEAVAARGVEVRAQIRDEVRTGVVSGESEDEIMDAALERFEELMTPTSDARSALRSARSALLSLEAAVDAWSAGSAPGSRFAQVAACAGVALAEMVRAVSAAGVELPPILETGVNALSGFAGAACAEGSP